jgi:hypothetical protein
MNGKMNLFTVLAKSGSQKLSICLHLFHKSIITCRKDESKARKYAYLNLVIALELGDSLSFGR